MFSFHEQITTDCMKCPFWKKKCVYPFVGTPKFKLIYFKSLKCSTFSITIFIFKFGSTNKQRQSRPASQADITAF